MKPGVIRALGVATFLFCVPINAFAQRTLHWDALQVDSAPGRPR